jgi:hypothetical protein
VRLQVQLGERHVPGLHPLRVFEPGSLDAVADSNRRAQVGAEEDAPVLQLLGQVVEPVLQLLHDVVDGHRAPPCGG